eukprot:CAMPEP_0201940496 /NCGR_PEP_ID=MMETSP0903-20130614/45367_1 /ASSEMBLY_ACC=CAM_ASM_000552 /TAXON_ID=420261 /ORGANISM="Thalassiosira antarctica, Strain CCMP982" /LENGTH=124 /DNA_ID=CAMNT_0048482323 /DNA_START=89 /DNA_END=460 /DNA_ORIENTATION=+
MKTSSNAIVAALFALSQSLAFVEAFATSKPIARTCLPPLHFKNELPPEIEDEVLVSNSKKGKKECCKGCPGCPLAATPRNNTEPNVLKASDGANKRGTIRTNYHDTGAGEGLPLFRLAPGLVFL